MRMFELSPRYPAELVLSAAVAAYGGDGGGNVVMLSSMPVGNQVILGMMRM